MEKLLAGARQLGLDLDNGQLKIFDVYYHELLDWNQKFNLTAITGYEDVQTKHFLDSLTAAAAVDFTKSLSVIDVGAGAGFPGIPLKIAFRGLRLALLEATAKKAGFLEHVVSALGLEGVEVINGRAEEIAHNPQYREKYDVVLSRAVASLPALIELTLPFARTGGCFIAYKKGDIEQEVAQSAKALKVMGGELRETVPVSAALFDDRRCLVKMEKIRMTPPKYPRRPGMPEKNPIVP